MSRRDLLKVGGLATVSLLVSQESSAAWTPSEYYPDPRIVAVDDSFRRYMPANAKIERIANDFRWAEGPVWFGDIRMLLWSDIPNNVVMRWDEVSRETSVFRYPVDRSSGHARDRQERLISCKHDIHRITCTKYDGSVTALAGNYQGKRLNSPNDVAVESDGIIWFTGPSFSISGFYKGRKVTPKLPQNIYCLELKSRKLSVVLGDIKGPDGLCFSPDEETLYVMESRATPNRSIPAWDMKGNTLKNKWIYLNCGNGTADGVAYDADDNPWCGQGNGNEELDGMRIFNPRGKHIGTIQLPERCTNLCFGGEQRNRLFMAPNASIYPLYANTQGAKLV